MLYNSALQERKYAYEFHDHLDFKAQSAELPGLRKRFQSMEKSTPRFYKMSCTDWTELQGILQWSERLPTFQAVVALQFLHVLRREVSNFCARVPFNSRRLES